MSKPTFPRLSWPHVAALAIIVAGVAAVLILAPDTTVGNILRVVSVLMGGVGGVGTAASSGVVRERPEPPASLPPRVMPTRKREGHAEASTYGVIAVLAILYAAGRSLWHLAHWLGIFAVLVVLGSGCAQAVKVASVLEPVGRVSCAIARKVVTVCDVAFPDTAPEEGCDAGGEAP